MIHMKKAWLGIIPSHFSSASCALHLGSSHLASHPIALSSPKLLSSLAQIIFSTKLFLQDLTKNFAPILALISALT